MIVQTSQSVRHLVGRLERGETVHEALLALANAHQVAAATVTALGAFEGATLVEYDQRAKRYREPRSFEGALEVLALTGNVSLKDGAPFLHLHACVSRETDNGIEVLGGHLVAARVFALEVTLVAYDDLTLERVPDPATGLALWRATDSRPMTPAVPAPPVSPVAPAGAAARPITATYAAQPGPAPAPAASPLTLPGPTAVAQRPSAEAVKQPEAMPPRPERLSEPDFGSAEVAVGDLLEHPQWGAVEIVKEPEPGRVDIRLPSGSVRSIVMEVFEVTARPERDGHKVWQLRPKRR